MEPHPADVAPPKDSTQLAYERTYLAHERTQMAWIRTALSLISFGFTISKFFEVLQNQQGANGPLLGAQTVGVMMIVFGLVGLALSSLQHRRALKSLRAQCPDLPPSLSEGAAVIMALLGILALAGAVIRS